MFTSNCHLPLEIRVERERALSDIKWTHLRRLRSVLVEIVASHARFQNACARSYSYLQVIAGVTAAPNRPCVNEYPQRSLSYTKTRRRPILCPSSQVEVGAGTLSEPGNLWPAQKKKKAALDYHLPA